MSIPGTALATHNSASTKHVLYSEILSVTSAMRRNSRWASSVHTVTARNPTNLGSNLGLRISAPASSAQHSRRGSKEAELMAGFYELKRTIQSVEDIRDVDLTVILAPFFAIIRSPLSTGPITSTALSSLHGIFVCGLIHSGSPNLEQALLDLSSTVSHCKFEASDSSGDEVVLLKILTLIQDCLCGNVGKTLGDVEVCEMLETVLTTCCQMRLSEILRRTAENTMQLLVRTVFSKLCTLDPATEEAKLTAKNDEDVQEPELKMNVQSQGIPKTEQESSEEKDNVENKNEGIEADQNSRPLGPHVQRMEYGLPSILELLRVLVNVLDPNDQQHTDSTRLIALRTLNAAFEESGHYIPQYPSLKALIVDHGCKYMFQLARSDNIWVLQAALRAISTMFETMRKHLKLQQELFLAFAIDRLAQPSMLQLGKGQVPTVQGKKSSFTASPRPGTPALPSTNAAPEAEAETDKGIALSSRVLVAPARGESRDLLLETLIHISRYPSFMIDLYINYDCDVNCENLFERLIDFLTKSVYPGNYGLVHESQRINAQYLCLDLLLTFVNDKTARIEGAPQPWPTDFQPPESLIQTKSQKELTLTGAARFNAKPKTGVAFLEEKKLIYNDLSPEISKAHSLARFLKECTRLDKRLLGDFISKPENIDILKAFIGLFDFRNKPIADAMRELLESFRLPGEAQQIARITETFASIYFASDPLEIKSEDAVYVLAYSVIMLNTDLHNPQIRKRMTIEDYTRNLRGVNNGTDFSPEFLQNIYDSIRKREIIMPEEHTGQLGFEYAWKELLARTRNAGSFMMCNTSLFDFEIFRAVWKPVISAISYAFINFEDDYIIQHAITGLRQCATLARHFNLGNVFDFVVVSLSQATSLLSETLDGPIPNYPEVDVEGQTITVSRLSVEFGTNVKGQLAAVVLFNIVNGNGNALREGWTQIFEMFQNLFLHSLLPKRMLQTEDFLGGVSMIPLRGNQPQRPTSRGDGGLLSTLSSYLMTPYSSSSDNIVPDATEADVENTLCTIDCITSCRLDELYSQIMKLDLEAMTAAVRALEALAHERTVARLKQLSDDIGAFQNSQMLPYDPASVFLLETMVSLSCQAPQYIQDLWPIVFEHLSALLTTSTQYSALLIERAVVSLLRLCLILAQKPALRDQVYVSFDLLSGLPSSVASSVGEQVVSGVILIIEKHKEIISSATEWNLIFALIRSTMPHPEAARLSFDLITDLASEGPKHHVTMDNSSGLVLLLDEFATAAGILTETQQFRSRKKEPITSASSPVVARAKKAIDLIANLNRQLPRLLEAFNVSGEQAWKQSYLPLLASLGRQSANAAREVRHGAVTHLQRILLGPRIVAGENEQSQVEDVFNRVIFPLIDELLKPQVLQRDPQGMPETRLRASALLCKTFMHLELRENQAKYDFRLLWIQILDLLDRLMNIDKNDQLYEAVPESLKNIVLVMNTSGILVSPPVSGEDSRDERQRTLWSATHERIERFLPGFLREVIPSPVSLQTTIST
ncbi:Sec7-like domain is implicated in guanine nucleotide exchange function [Amanita rubescens]|nr:Sec7-like domain is implicated in guanine nucleotide exchange function [Amanita rubescens]